MKEIILSIEQTKSAIDLWKSKKSSQIDKNFGDYLLRVHNIIELEIVSGDGVWNRLRIKTKTPEQLTWFLLNI